MRLCLFVPLFLAVSLITPARAATPPEAILLVMGDQHSAYEKAAPFVALVDRVQRENPGVPLAILINGDSFEYGNVVARRSEAQVDLAMFAALAKRAPTVLNLGNHEPDFFNPAETVAKLRAAGVTVISGNARDRKTNQPLAPAFTTLKFGSREATVVGLLTDRLSTFRIAIRPDLDLADPVVWAKQNLAGLLQPSAVPIVLSHSGIRADREIMPLVPAGTLFAGAHDHLRFVERVGGTLYFHSGSWMEYCSIARLRWVAEKPQWDIEQVPLANDGAADPALQQLVREVRARHLTPADRVVVGRQEKARPVAAAARFVAEALRRAAGAEAAFIGNTTFGAGLPAGEISQVELDACVRFDGAIFTTTVSGARLQQLLAAANQGPETPFAQRTGEFSFAAAGASALDPARQYLIATTDWGAQNTARYFGEPALVWVAHPTLKLKAAVLPALAGGKPD